VPDPFERHARPKDPSGWDGQNPRSARAAAANDDVPKRAPGKKDKNLCKAAHWKGPHTPELRMGPVYGRMGSRCGWGVSWHSSGPAYLCYHEEVCTGCGKVMRISIGKEECPAYAPLTDERRAQIEQQLEESRLRRARWLGRRRPVIDGPQGYRKPKETDV
jgi:hypothetical protein